MLLWFRLNRATSVGLFLCPLNAWPTPTFISKRDIICTGRINKKKLRTPELEGVFQIKETNPCPRGTVAMGESNCQRLALHAAIDLNHRAPPEEETDLSRQKRYGIFHSLGQDTTTQRGCEKFTTL